MLYRLLIRPFLYLLPPEVAHRFALRCLDLLTAIPGLATVMRRLMLRRNTIDRIDAFGLQFPNAIGLAAGFDKDARVYESLGALGFGFVEVGTLTARPQPGNLKPRLFRLVRDRALINRMGFNNCGAQDAATRLARQRHTVIGVNVGRTKVVAPPNVLADYNTSARILGPYADFMVVNVSSPNTPGLRGYQSPDKLRPLLSTIRQTLDSVAVKDRVPLLLKIGPDLSDHDIQSVADLAVEMGIDGIIAVNTTVGRDHLETSDEELATCGQGGGLSGPPVHERSLQVLRLIRARVGDALTLISVGGIETAEQAWERIRAGASLVQVYTAFVYDGPGLPHRLVTGVRHLAISAKFERVQDAIGTVSFD